MQLQSIPRLYKAIRPRPILDIRQMMLEYKEEGCAT